MLSATVCAGGTSLTSRRLHPLQHACPCSSGRLRSVIANAKSNRKKQKKAVGGVQTASPDEPPTTVTEQPSASPAAAAPRQSPAPAASAPAAPISPGRAGPTSPPSTSGRPAVETPQVVVDRMFSRVLVCAGLPVATGVLLFPLFWYLKVVLKLEYPIWVVYVASALTFGGGLLGITYGILSTSWDPRRDGSALGWTELQANLGVLLNRNKDGNS